MKELSVRHKTMQIREETRGGKFHNIGIGNDFMDVAPKHKQWQEN